MKVFITGDRQIAAIYPLQVLLEVVRAQAQGRTIVTGTLGGVEMLVRGLDEEIEEFHTEVIEHSLVAETGKPDFIQYSQVVANDDDIVEVVVIHADPHTSSVVKAFLAAAEDKTRLVTPADLLQ